MTKNNDVTRALDSLLEDIARDELVGFDCSYFIQKHGKEIRTALLKSAQVDGLVEIVTAIRDTATGDSVTIAAVKEAAREQLKQFSATEI